ncbi:MAG: iron complex outermembrane receptor protein, partial [Dokdonia sp.]
VKITKHLTMQPNIALSSNKNQDFIFQRDGVLTNIGDTNISFSPDIVIGNTIRYAPIEGFQVSFLSKYVGEQYMGNIDSNASILDAFFVNDLSVSYELKNIPIFKSIIFNGLVNNIFDKKYVSNGYFFTFDDDFSVPGDVTTIEGAGYYPQSGINFLLGATLKF